MRGFFWATFFPITFARQEKTGLVPGDALVIAIVMAGFARTNSG